MKIKIIGSILLLLISNQALSYKWTSAVPTQVHIVTSGLVLLGEFDLNGVTCATGPKAIYLSNTDESFDHKLALALSANASGKKISVLIDDSIETNCTSISAMGYVPVVHRAYWQLKN